MNQPLRKPYIIETKPLPERYARGWHCIGKADSFGSEPRAMNYFGSKWVAYRGEELSLIHI